MAQWHIGQSEPVSGCNVSFEKFDSLKNCTFFCKVRINLQVLEKHAYLAQLGNIQGVSCCFNLVKLMYL